MIDHGLLMTLLVALSPTLDQLQTSATLVIGVFHYPIFLNLGWMLSCQRTPETLDIEQETNLTIILL